VSALPAREAYRLWAPRYQEETAVTFLDDRLVREITPPLAGRRLLDVGCGTGRRLAATGAALAVGVDLSFEMLAAGREAGLLLAAADLRRLPVATAAFDVVWCRLAIGHVREIGAAYAELARVCRPGGIVVVTDFHPEAVAAGHRRTFRDGAGVVREVEHHLHAPESHEAWAALAGLEACGARAGRVGPAVRAFYTRAERLAAYEAQKGLALVLALAFRRGGSR
jgi:malonyl-CoA O-methyltransferase